ncbi:hypothetical protein BJ138DRAFT_948223 [Hygrophoropsis aurantiaca]|uniref:Uncharacterized protein n=1 Tax=Hygrophoropsis aurantiaca TaxID=72124 RepID=A0ACB8ADD8_9AGAM|nr:hypothetical protein BJ138DRAFT_948223 [Hygrophoropsis aurantiaca]
MSNAVVTALRLQMVKYFKMSGMAVLAYDYCINFDMEVRLTWNRPWRFVRVLFVLARYLPFLEVPIDLYYSLAPKSTATCLPLYQVAAWLNIIGTLAAECFLLIRTWLLWGRNRNVLIGLIALAVACIAGTGVVGDIALKSMRYNPPPLSTSGCYQTYTQAVHVSVWNYALLALFELVVLLLTIYQTLHHIRQTRSFVIVRNGIFYVLCILAMAVINIIVFTSLPVCPPRAIRYLPSLTTGVCQPISALP